MEGFTEKIIELFRERALFDELKDCKIYQNVEQAFYLRYESHNEDVSFEIFYKYPTLTRVAKECGLEMHEFNEELFRKKVNLEELKNCTITREMRRNYYLIIESDSEEVLAKLWKHYRVLAKTARECGFFGYLGLQKGQEAYSPWCEIELLEDY